MAYVLVSIGSNINRYQYITASLDALQQNFGELLISPVYESESVGFDGSDFLNLVVGFNSDLSVPMLSELLRKIEQDNGRRRDGPRFSPRTLDIDILTYDDAVGDFDGIVLPRDEITKNAFVLLPLFNIVPQWRHPVNKKTYAELWQAYDQSSQKLWPVNFRWNEQIISDVG
jgi:2-amino-4-hydroxy-6-hydroxymethyldihydropteridine diphosphokinase